MTWISANLRLLIIIIVGIALAVLLFSINSCLNQRQEAAQAKQDVKSADAYAGAAKEAVATVVERAKADTDIDTLVAAATLEINNAENPEIARAAVVSAVCKLRSYHARPECALLSTGAGNMGNSR